MLTGNMPLAMKIGAGLQLVYLGVTSTPGGNVPSDPALGFAITLSVIGKKTLVPFFIVGFFAVMYLKL